MKTLPVLLLTACLTVSIAKLIAQPVPFAGDGTVGYSGDNGPATQAQLYWISGFTGDAAGNIYISDGGNSNVRKVNTANIISTYAGNQIAGFSGDGGTAITASINQWTGAISGGGSANEIAFDAAGNMYINDRNNYRIRKVNPAGIISTVAGNGIQGNSGNGGLATAAQINVAGMAVEASGNIYISDAGNHVIRKINTSGVINIIAGTGVAGYTGDNGLAANATLQIPCDLAIDLGGNLFVADRGNYVIRKINTSGIISTYAGNGTEGNSGDGGLATSAKIRPAIYMPMTFNSNNELHFVASTAGGTGGYKATLRKVNSAGIITTVLDSSYFAMGGDFVLGINAIFIDANNSFYFCPDAAFCVGFIDPGTLYTISLGLSVVCTSTNPTCNGQCNGTATAIASGTGAAPPYTYFWNPTGQTTSTATGLCAGNYTVTVTDATGAKAVSSGTITQPPPLIVAASANPTAIISGSCATLTATGGSNYSWSNGSLTNPTIVCPSGTGTTVYCVTVTDANGCTDTACVTVTAPPITPNGDPHLLTPNGDGKEDQIFISCESLTIYNRNGILVRNINGSGVWDGKDNSGLLIPMGYYVAICKETGVATTISVIR